MARDGDRGGMGFDPGWVPPSPWPSLLARSGRAPGAGTAIATLDASRVGLRTLRRHLTGSRMARWAKIRNSSTARQMMVPLFQRPCEWTTKDGETLGRPPRAVRAERGHGRDALHRRDLARAVASRRVEVPGHRWPAAPHPTIAVLICAMRTSSSRSRRVPAVEASSRDYGRFSATSSSCRHSRTVGEGLPGARWREAPARHALTGAGFFKKKIAGSGLRWREARPRSASPTPSEPAPRRRHPPANGRPYLIFERNAKGARSSSRPHSELPAPASALERAAACSDEEAWNPSGRCCPAAPDRVQRAVPRDDRWKSRRVRIRASSEACSRSRTPP